MYYEYTPDAPIGVFDSGVGGVGVLRYAQRQLPNENFIYYGDILNAPYGEKSLTEIQQLSRKAVEFLAAKRVKALLIACNTATAAAAQMLRAEEWPFPIFGMEPAVKPACEALNGKTIAVLATPATLRLDKYRRLTELYADKNRIIAVPCPGLSRLIEIAGPDSADVRLYLDELFEGMPNPDGIVVGCTHYSYLGNVLRARCPQAKLFDGALGTVRHMAETLAQRGMLSSRSTPGAIELHSTQEDRQTAELFEKFFCMEIFEDDA